MSTNSTSLNSTSNFGLDSNQNTKKTQKKHDESVALHVAKTTMDVKEDPFLHNPAKEAPPTLKAKVGLLLRGSSNSPSKEDLTIQHLNKHLNTLHESVGELSKQITEENKVLFREIEECRKSIIKECDDIKDAIANETAIIVNDNKKNAYDSNINKLKKRTLKIYEILRQFQAEPITEKKLSKFIGQISANVETSKADVNNGFSHPKIPDYINQVYLNPEYYSGLISYATDEIRPSIPSLAVFLRLVDCYFAAQKESDKYTNEQIIKDLEKIRNTLVRQGNNLISLYNSFPNICEKAANIQGSLLSIVNDQIKKNAVKTENQNILNIKKSIKEIKGRENVFAGEARFGLSKLINNKREDYVTLPKNEELIEMAEKKLKYSENKGTSNLLLEGLSIGLPQSLVVGATVIIATSTGGPIAGAAVWKACAAATAYATTMTGCVAFGCSFNFGTEDAEKLKNILAAPLSLVHEEVNVPDSNCLTVSLVARKALSELKVSRVGFKRNQTCDFNLFKDIKFRHPVVELIFFKDEEGVHCNHRFPGDFPLTPSERKLIPLFESQKINIEERFKDYLEFLESENESAQWMNVNKADASIVCGKDTSMIPLAFPKPVIQLIKIEKRYFEAKGWQLHPSYTFVQNEADQSYELSIVWDLSKDNEYFGERGKLIIASFDQRSVNAFGSVAITEDNRIVQESPNLNEFLLHAMYGFGLPGKETISLREQSIAVPADIAFGGVYFLLGKKLKRINFDSKRIGVEDLSGDALFGEHIKPVWTPLNPLVSRQVEDGEIPGVKELYQSYCQLHYVAKAMCKTLFDFEILEILGLSTPSRGLDKELYSHVIATPGLMGVPPDDVKQMVLELLKEEKNWGLHYQGLIGALKKLEEAKVF